MTLSLDTALSKPALRVRPPYLFYCFTLSTRCLHCDTVNFGLKLGALGTNQIRFAAQTVKQICQAKKCRLSSWQNVGIYCDVHYLIVPYLCHSVFGWGNKRLKMSRSLVENLDAPGVLTGMSDRIFESKTSDLAHIFQAILNPDPNGPRVYAVDTEFYRPSTKGSSVISEVAFIDVKNGLVVLHAVLDDDKRAMEASTKLTLRKSNKESLIAKDAPQVRTATDLFRQLRDCHFGPDDIIVEWSINFNSLLDVQLIRSFLLQNGYDNQVLLPSGGYAVLRSTRKFLEQVLKLRSWSLPFFFRVLFRRIP